MPEKTVITFHKKLTKYDLGEGHPFRGDRFINVMRFLEAQHLFQLPNITLVEPQQATKQDILRVHDEVYVERIFQLAHENKSYNSETPVSTDILEGALLICGSAIECGKHVFENKVHRAVALGGGHHHAGRNYGGGFCIFNDVAVLVEYLRISFQVDRFLILDHDVHFGNGTSDIYYKDPTVLYISLHQDPRTIYPGTGFTWQIGQGKGEGYNVNIPLPPGTSDETYLYALNEIFVPLAEEFEPQIIITNGGSDPHFGDSLGSLALTTNGFFELARTIRLTGENVCGGRVITIPGSGYNPKVLPQCWYALIAGISGLDEVKVKEPYAPPTEPSNCRKTVEKTLDELKRQLRKQWGCFGGFTISGVQ